MKKVKQRKFLSAQGCSRKGGRYVEQGCSYMLERWEQKGLTANTGMRGQIWKKIDFHVQQFPLLYLVFNLRLCTTHLPSVLPHSRVQILGRCWMSTVSQLNKTIWKQSGLMNVPAQSDPSPFVAVEKNGLSESRGWRASEGRHTISIHRLPPIHPLRPTFTTSSPPHIHPHF